MGVYGNYLATHYFKMQGYDVLNEVGVYDNGNLLTRADLSFIDSNGIRNYCEVKAAYQIIDNIRNYKDNSLEKTGYYKNLDAEIIKYKKIGEKLIKQVKKLSKDGSLVNVIIFDGCYMDEIIKQELKNLDANLITLNVNIYDLEENIKKKAKRVLAKEPNEVQNMKSDLEKMKELGYHEGYLYPHDFPGHYVEQQYLPDKMVGTKYYVKDENCVQ